MFFDYDPMVVESRGPWRYPFHPPYPLIMKSEGRRARTTSCERQEQEDESVVPGSRLVLILLAHNENTWCYLI